MTGLGLAMTSSTGVIGMAIGPIGASSDRVTNWAEIATERRHAEEISPLLQRLLAEAGIALTDLDVLVVDIGPGRFTGLRVGLATVKGLALALGTPVVGLTSLEILAGVRGGTAGPVTGVIDARRNEVFQQVFDGARPIGEAEVGPADRLAARARGLVIGDGLDRYPEPYRTQGLTVETGRNPDGRAMLELAAGRDAVPGREITASYLRLPDATPNIKTRRGAA